MSETSVQFIIGRAVTDPEFRELLFSDPDSALEGIELTSEEALAVRGIEREGFESLAGELEQRISRAGLSVQDFTSVINFAERGDLGPVFRSIHIIACPIPTPHTPP